MAYLDNCGTIILDAILTDVGRRKMAQGNFDVRKFALGDDEVDYGLFIADEIYSSYLADNSHKMDRRILSQSVFEALDRPNAVITYGLHSFERNDLMYLPELKINYSGSVVQTRPEGITDAAWGPPAAQPHEQKAFARPYGGTRTDNGGIFYFAVNDETNTKLKDQFGGNTNYILENNQFSHTKVVIESGIDSSAITATPSSRDAFILGPGLLDMYYNVYADSRFFSYVLGPPSTAVFKNKADGTLLANFEPLEPAVRVSLPGVIDQYDTYVIQGAANRVFYTSTTPTDRNVSAIRGPRGGVVALGFNVINEMSGESTATRNKKYTIFGKTDQTLFGGSNKYDYIDSTIYVMGVTSGARIEVPLRIIRYAGT